MLVQAPDLEEAGVEEGEEQALHKRKNGDAAGAEAEPFPLLELPIELILAVFEYLTVPALNAVRAAGCRLLTAVANDPSLWRAFYNRHRRYAAHSAVGSMVHVGEAEEEGDDGGCWRGSPGIDRADVKRFGWRQLAITLMKRRCFQCGAQPSFVVFLDNTRKCQKCISTEKLRREVEETKRWELKHQQPQQSEDEDKGNEHEDNVEQQAKRMKTTLCTEESKQKRRAVKVSRRLTRLGALLGEAGKHADAETLLLEVLTRDIALHGESSLVVANDYHNLAHLCKLRSNTFVYVRDEKIKICRRGMDYIAEAVRVYEKYLAETVVRRRRRMPAEESNELLLRIGDCLCMLAGYLCTTSTHLTFAHKLEAEQSALRFLEKAMAVYVKMGDERGLAEAYRISAGIFADTHHQDKAKAIDYLQRSLALVDKIFGRESVQAADIMQKFGYMYWNWDRESVPGLEKSLEWHQKELEIRGKVMGLTHPITKRTREDVYIILDRLGRLPEARELYADLPPEEGEHVEI